MEIGSLIKYQHSAEKEMEFIGIILFFAGISQSTATYEEFNQELGKNIYDKILSSW